MKFSTFFTCISQFLFLLITNLSFCQTEKDSVLISYILPSDAELKYWNWVNEYSLGIDGSTPGTERINRYPAIKFTRANWIPVDGYKHTLKGKVTDFKGHKGEFLHDYEEDWNIHVIPDSNFNYLINYPYSITQSACQWFDHNDTLVIECEITPDNNFSYNNKYFKLGERSILQSLPFFEDIFGNQIEGSHPNWQDGIEGIQFCFYGPWVREKLHDYRPEIHPIQLVWFKERFECDTSERYTVMSSEDITDYFDGNDDFFTNDDSFFVWSGNVLQTEYKIAFKINKNKESINFKINLPPEQPNFKKLETLNLYRNTADKDKYISKYNYKDKETERNLISIQVDESISEFVKVSLKDVRLLNDTIFGFITLNLTIKKNIIDNNLEGGYYVLNIISKKIFNDSTDRPYIINNIVNKQIISEEKKLDPVKLDVLFDNNFYKNTSYNSGLNDIKFITNKDTIEALESINKELYLNKSMIFDTGYVKYKLESDSIEYRKYKPVISNKISKDETIYDKKYNLFKNIAFTNKIILSSSPMYVYNEKNTDTVSNLLLDYLNNVNLNKDKFKLINLYKTEKPFQIRWDTLAITNYDNKDEEDLDYFNINIINKGEKIIIQIPQEYKSTRLIFNAYGTIRDTLGNQNRFSFTINNFVSTKDTGLTENKFLEYYNTIFGESNGKIMFDYAYLNQDLVTKLEIIDTNFIKARILRFELEREFYDRPNYNIRPSVIERLMGLGSRN